jgi:hypothetical protein
MELSAYAVDWDLAVKLLESGRLERVLLPETEDDERELESLQLPSPWGSDSHVQYMEVEEAYRRILRERLDEAERERTEKALKPLINDETIFPNDLPGEVDGDLVAGALSPQRVAELAAKFAELPYDELAQLWDELVFEKQSDLQMAAWRSEDAFTGYLRQWHELLRFAAERRAGVFVRFG